MIVVFRLTVLGLSTVSLVRRRSRKKVLRKESSVTFCLSHYLVGLCRFALLFTSLRVLPYGCFDSQVFLVVAHGNSQWKFKSTYRAQVAPLHANKEKKTFEDVLRSAQDNAAPRRKERRNDTGYLCALSLTPRSVKSRSERNSIDAYLLSMLMLRFEIVVSVPFRASARCVLGVLAILVNLYTGAAKDGTQQAVL